MKFKGFLLSAVAAMAFLTGAATAGDRPLTVVELYTSQGCSSCPLADALLTELAATDGILALSFHVDYWDYIGWKDPFASPENTSRQRHYAQLFELRYVYTPQMVVQGVYQTVGSQRDDVFDHIETARKLPRVALKVTKGAAGLRVSLPKAELAEDARVLSVFFDDRHETSIRRGENSGRTLAYSNVVRDVKAVGRWSGEARTMDVPVDHGVGDACAILLQSIRSGRIIGAGVLDLDGRS